MFSYDLISSVKSLMEALRENFISIKTMSLERWRTFQLDSGIECRFWLSFTQQTQKVIKTITDVEKFFNIPIRIMKWCHKIWLVFRIGILKCLSLEWEFAAMKAINMLNYAEVWMSVGGKALLNDQFSKKKVILKESCLLE